MPVSDKPLPLTISNLMTCFKWDADLSATGFGKGSYDEQLSDIRYAWKGHEDKRKGFKHANFEEGQRYPTRCEALYAMLMFMVKQKLGPHEQAKCVCGAGLMIDKTGDGKPLDNLYSFDRWSFWFRHFLDNMRIRCWRCNYSHARHVETCDRKCHTCKKTWSANQFKPLKPRTVDLRKIDLRFMGGAA